MQIVADEKVIVESKTLAELGAADAAWLPQEMGSTEGPPPEEVMNLEDDMSPPEEEVPTEPVEVTSGG